MKLALFNEQKNRLIHASIGEYKVELKIGSPSGSFITKEIPITEWDKYLREKLCTGYKEYTQQIEEKQAERHPVLDTLANLSRQIVENNLKLTIKPTKEAVSEAREILLNLSQENDLVAFNEGLYKLFSLIPRKMRNPILYTSKNVANMKEVLEREDSIINNLEILDEPESKDEILFKDATHDEVKTILKHLDDATKQKFKALYKVENKNQNYAFSEYVKKHNINSTSLLFHGSRNENWYSIIKTGLKCNPVNVVITGKMFGNGIYFANKADKSCGYTSLIGSRWVNGSESYGYIAVYEVATGKEYITDSFNSLTLGNMDENLFKSRFHGYNSFHALAGRGLRADEIIIYNDNACRIKYLIQLQS